MRVSLMRLGAVAARVGVSTLTTARPRAPGNASSGASSSSSLLPGCARHVSLSSPNAVGMVGKGLSLPDCMPSADLDGLAAYIGSGKCGGGVAFLTGAGMSVSAGIPDFRSPGGMYDTLRPELLSATEAQRSQMRSEPTTVVSWPLFRVNPRPYLELRRPFILGVAERQWKPTLAHWFIRACHDRGILRRVYTQNIDGLDHQIGVPGERVVSVHGTMGTVSCEFCGAEADVDTFRRRVKKDIKDIYGVDDDAPAESSLGVACERCGKPGVKPDTVLYGSSLPGRFFQLVDDDDPNTGDLPNLAVLFIAGTSLTVGPANSVATLVGPRTIRVVVNLEPVGQDLGVRYGGGGGGGSGGEGGEKWEGEMMGRDLFLRGGCDEVFARLADALGWLDDFAARREDLAPRSREILDEALATKRRSSNDASAG